VSTDQPSSAYLRHELRTQLNHIIGYGEMLLEDVEGGKRAEFAVQIRAILEDAGRLLEVVNDYLVSPSSGASTVPRAQLSAKLFAPLDRIIAANTRLTHLAIEAGAIDLLTDLERITVSAARLSKVVGHSVAPVQVPRAVTAATERAPGVQARAPGGPAEREAILVVEDDETNRDVLLRRLAREGYTNIVTAANGRQALDLLHQRPFDLVLLDILMPELNGYEVLEELKSDEHLRDVPVIMISAVTELDSVIHCIEAGAEDYLPKPFNPTLLRARIGASLEKKRLRDQVILEQENLRKAKEAAEVASRYKSEFLTNTSHELRTPLNAIIGITEMLLEVARDLKRDDEIEPLERVIRAARQLLALINDILDLSKIEAGKMELRLEPFAIAPLIEDVFRTIQPLARNNGNELVVNCPADVGSMSADQTRVRQALLNLVSNANRFTERGKVTLSVSRTAVAGAEWIAMAVADSGIGMTPEQMGRLFQAFVQADESTTRKYSGTGLGLAISRRFCQMMGGDITVASNIGRGSTFTIRLPVKADSNIGTEAASIRTDGS
jgi:signal transduction histidine kinase